MVLVVVMGRGKGVDLRVDAARVILGVAERRLVCVIAELAPTWT